MKDDRDAYRKLGRWKLDQFCPLARKKCDPSCVFLHQAEVKSWRTSNGKAFDEFVEGWCKFERLIDGITGGEIR